MIASDGGGIPTSLANASVIAALAEMGIAGTTIAAIGMGRDPVCGPLEVMLAARSREGRLAPVRLRIEGRCLRPLRAGPDVHWSASPSEFDEVVVAPDLLTGLLLEGVLVASGTRPFAILSPIAANPDFWRDPNHWPKSRRIVLLADGLFEAGGHLDALTRSGCDARIAVLPHRRSWQAALVCQDLGIGHVLAVLDRSIPMSRLGVVARRRLRGPAPCTPCGVDGNGRLMRVLRMETVEDAFVLRGGMPRQHRQMCQLIVRSDRRLLEVNSVPALPGTPPSQRLVQLEDGTALNGMPTVSMSIPWSVAGVEEFVAGGIGDWRLAAAVLASDLALVIGEMTGVASEAAAQLASFVQLTYVFQALDRLPLLWVLGEPGAARLSVLRVMTRLCHHAHAVGRDRARGLARLADATRGTLILEDPGCVTGPSGPSEVGRFLIESSMPGVSTVQACEGQSIRTLETFGPRAVFARAAALLPAAVPPIIARVHGEGVGLTIFAEERLQTLVDRLYGWSMDAVAAAIADPAAKSDVESLLMIAPMPTEVAGKAAAPQPHHALQSAAADLSLEPAVVMGEAFDRCSSLKSAVTLAELTLEAALIGGTGDPYSPERVGRWMAMHPRLDPDRPVQRRRLHGEIMRIYPIVGSESDGDDPFAFCSGACADCRFGSVCAKVAPALRQAKYRRG